MPILEHRLFTIEQWSNWGFAHFEWVTWITLTTHSWIFNLIIDHVNYSLKVTHIRRGGPLRDPINNSKGRRATLLEGRFAALTTCSIVRAATRP